MRITILLCIVFVITTSMRGDDSLPSNAQAALVKNASLFSNLLITGERSRRPFGPIETVLKRLQTRASEADFTKTLGFELRFQGPLFRESIEHPPGESYTRDALYEASYDGTKFILGYKILNDLSNSSISIYTPAIATAYAEHKVQKNALDKMKFWYLRETGFSGPNTISTLGQPVESTILNAAENDQMVSVSKVAENEKMLEVIIKQPEPWQSLETFDIETHGPFQGLLNGTDVLQKRIERERRQLAGKHRLIRFWLNSALGYAVEEKWEIRRETGETMFHTKNSDFVKVAPDGVWMPRLCVVESHTDYTVPVFVSPDPLYETVIKVDQCEPGNFDDGQFRIWYDYPGAIVSDWTSPKATLTDSDQYRVAASIDDLPRGPAGFTRWFVVLNILFIAGWLGWWYSQSRKRKTET